jgi:hypothetical protein
MLTQDGYGLRNALVIAACSVAGACAIPTDTDTAGRADPRNASTVEWAGNPELSRTLAAVRASTAVFHDEAVARAAGYRPSAAGCEFSSVGAMGIHYGNPALLGLVPGSRPTTGTDAAIDPLRPEVLMYEVRPDGTRRLVGIEYVVYRAAWDAVHAEPPRLLGVPFDQKFGADAHGHADHYELHVWLWRHNPLGMFSPWNPKVDC